MTEERMSLDTAEIRLADAKRKYREAPERTITEREYKRYMLYSYIEPLEKVIKEFKEQSNENN